MRLATPAIVLRAVNYGDADRVLTLFTEQVGKVSVLARGARKGSRRHSASGIGLFTTGITELELRTSGAGLDRLRRFDVGNGYAHLGLDVGRLAHASYAAELVSELTQPHQAEPELYRQLVEFFTYLDRSAPTSERLRCFELQLLDLVGLGPELAVCRACASTALGKSRQGFSITLGGVVCGVCSTEGLSLPEGARQALLKLRQTGATADLSYLTPWAALLGGILRGFLQSHTGRQLRTAAFIQDLNYSMGQLR